MPRRPDSLFAYWISKKPGLSGYPSSKKNPSRNQRPQNIGEDLSSRISIPSSIEIKDLQWDRDADASLPTLSRLVIRDNLGFRYERIVGLHDLVSRAEAAKMLKVSLMSVGRYIRSKALPHRTRTVNGRKYSVVKVADVWRLANRLKLRVSEGRMLVVVGTADDSDGQGSPQKDG